MTVVATGEDVSLMVHSPECASDNGDLLEFYSYLHGAWRTVINTHIKDLQKVRESLDRQLEAFMKEVIGKLNPNWTSFEEIGLRLYYNIVPDDVRDILRKSAGNPGTGSVPHLRVYLPKKLTWIPWEIMYDDEFGFLGLSFQIARLPIMSRVPDFSVITPHTVHTIYNLLGQDVEDDVFTFDTWQSTFTDVISGLQDIRYPPYKQAANNQWPTKDQIHVEADILHITCHGGLEDNNGMYWTLKLYQGETKHEIREETIQLNRKNLQKFRSLVFGNACALIASKQNSSTTLTPGFGPTFYENGAVAFVGTCAPITKLIALEFPRKFYEFLLKEGLPIGEALLKTKAHFNKQKGTHPTWNDPSWLFYCLYGSPVISFQVS